MLAELSASMWAASPQRACHAIDAWAGQHLLSGKAIAQWAFQAPGFRSLEDELAVSIVWTALTASVQRYQVTLAVSFVSGSKHVPPMDKSDLAMPCPVPA